MEKIDVFLVITEFILCAFLRCWAELSEKSPDSKSRLLFLAPAVLCVFMTYAAGIEICMAGVYIASVLAVLGFFGQRKKFRRILSAVCAVLVISAVPACMLDDNYRNRVDFVSDFEKGFASISEHYALTKYKDIDMDALHEKYLPMFRQAYRDHDKYENFIAWNKFCAEFYDGHVGFSADKSTSEEALRRAYGNDYGLVIMTLADGKTVAVNADESLSDIGIHNGTEIISWDGVSPAEAEKMSDARLMHSFADIDNEKFYEGIFAAGVGGESVSVEFVNDAGEKITAVLPKLEGSFYDRFNDAIEIVNRGVEAANMSFTQLDDTTVCLRIKYMIYDSQSSSADDHSGLLNDLRSTLAEYTDAGVKDVIIDIRSNGGGSGNLVENVAALFAPEGTHYYVTNAEWDPETNRYAEDENGNYNPGKDVYFTGHNVLGDEGRVILLVNSGSASASDHLTKVMRGMENVTVMGFTETNGSAQGVYGLELKSGMLSYSSSVLLDSDGSIFVDSGTDHQSGNGVDIKVPLDETAVTALFDNDEDYILGRALELLHAD